MVGQNWRATRLVPALACALLAASAAIVAQDASAVAPRTPEQVRLAVDARYTVVPLKDGVALVPRRPAGTVKSIEVSSQGIAVNGEPVSGAELIQRLGQPDASLILALSYLEPARVHALFGVRPTEPPSIPPPEAGERAPAPTADLPEGPEAASGRRESRRNIVRELTRSDARIHVGGGVEVRESESVDGPVVAVGGPAIINGEVRQDVVAVGGDVRVGPRGRVLGDVTTVGGNIDKDPQGEIVGRRNQVGIRIPQFQLRPSLWLPGGLIGHAFGAPVEFFAMVFRMLLFGLLACVVFLVARNPIARIEHAAAAEPWRAGLVGLLAQLLFIPVFVVTVVVLTVSIIGIPLLLFVPPLAILIFAVALLLGFTGIAYRVGRWAQSRFGWGSGSPFFMLLVGLLAIWLLTIAARAIALGGLAIWALSSALLVLGFLVEYVAWTVGLGAAVMTRLGTRGSAG